MDERILQRLQDILDVSAELDTTLRGCTAEAFRGDRQKQRVAERLLEIAGEAATHVPDEVAAAVPGNWDNLRKMRILLAHAYRRVDADRLWQASTIALPRLGAAIRENVPGLE